MWIFLNAPKLHGANIHHKSGVLRFRFLGKLGFIQKCWEPLWESEDSFKDILVDVVMFVLMICRSVIWHRWRMMMQRRWSLGIFWVTWTVWLLKQHLLPRKSMTIHKDDNKSFPSRRSSGDQMTGAHTCRLVFI